MEELLSVVAANLSMAGEDGETFRREAASALLAYSEDAQQLEFLLASKPGLAVVAALARTRAGLRDGLGALVNLMAFANASGEPAMDALVARAREPEIVDAACVPRRATLLEAARRSALMFLQNLTTRPCGAEAVARREEAVTALTKRFAARAAAAPRRARCCPSSSTATSTRSARGRREAARVAARRHCCHDKDEHFYLLSDLHAPTFALFALADASDAARLANDDHEALALPGRELERRARCPAVLREAAETLGDSKKREPDARVTLSLLEALLCLASTRRAASGSAHCGPRVAKDCDFAFAPGRDDRDDADAGGDTEVLVTTDDAPEPDEATLSEDEILRKHIARSSAATSRT
ncbi:hypothetical protein SO694_00026383 [Aureococcus anophagefferens]|uniref:Protein HGH1 homolog n=1 Tax=Aureococcus anophagefferens TaxID=44056 RepID=A0ABR1FUP4_AURAN